MNPLDRSKMQWILLAALACVLATAAGCKQAASIPNAGPAISDTGRAGARVDDTRADVGDAAAAVAATTQRTGSAVERGQALTASVPVAEIREGLYRVWAEIREQIGSLGRTSQQLVAMQDRLVKASQDLGAAEQKIAEMQQSHADAQRVAESKEAALRTEIAELKASTSREAERASSWGVVAGGIACAAGITLMIASQSLWGKALAIGGMVLSGVLVAVIQLFRAGDAIAPLLPWLFGSLGVLFVGWLAWEVWQRHSTNAAYATGLEQQARDIAGKDAGRANELRERATSIWRAIDAGYDRLWRKGV